jgi:hypothetical protein
MVTSYGLDVEGSPSRDKGSLSSPQRSERLFSAASHLFHAYQWLCCYDFVEQDLEAIQHVVSMEIKCELI